MLKIYDVETAQKTILRRQLASEIEFPEQILKSTERLFGQGTTPITAVFKILSSIRNDGDEALLRWSEMLDGMRPDKLAIQKDRITSAYKSLPDSLTAAMEFAAERIRKFHQMQPLPNWQSEILGGKLGQRVTPIARVGIYVPGGTAPLPSSLLMSVIPAQVAGVGEIVICTPPNPHQSILAAAYICGIETIYQAGGAQAIAAMAFGTQTVPKVDKIVGAGNLFVTLAKQQVFGIVGLDGLAGPTETMVIADHTSNPAWVAADLLAQAEHDILASAILLTPETSLAENVQSEIEKQIEELSRKDIIFQSLVYKGGIVVTPDLETAASLANAYAPEHLCIAVAHPEKIAEQINNAGGLFIGEYSFEVLGDYIAGPSHVMPTGGTARFASPLNVLDFVKISSIIALDRKTSQELSPYAAEIAQVESLSAHASAAQYRRSA